MQPTNDNNQRTTPLSENDFERDPKQRCAYYPNAEVWVTCDETNETRPAAGESFVISETETPSVAKAIALIVEFCVLDLAEIDFTGKLRIEVDLSGSVKSPWFIAWEHEHGSLD